MKSAQYRVFVCTKQRAPGDEKGCCCNVGALDIYQAFVDEIAQRQLSDRVQVSRSGCLDYCEMGAIALVSKVQRYEPAWLPTKIQKRILSHKHWYVRLTVADIPEIVESHLVHGQPLERKSFYV